MRLLAPAKLNLHLRVAPLESSGFHPLMSWMCCVALFDTLTIEHADGGQFSLSCDDPKVPGDESNLMMRAARALLGQSDQRPRGLRMRLEKRIPPGGGLGGGSSDAARTLLAINQLENLGWSTEQLARIAANLGSDVPFFLHGPSSVCTGRGQIVRPIQRPRPRWGVLILPPYALSTQSVYQKFDELRCGERRSIEIEPPWQQWADLSAGPLMSRLVNDLEPAAFALCPQLRDERAALEQLLLREIRMSGSGSSLFVLYDELIEAQTALARMEERRSVRAIIVALAPDVKDDVSA